MIDNRDQGRFQEAYQGEPPWDLGRPQKQFVESADQIIGTILDVGCGTGDNLLWFAERGHPVLGIDFIDVPIEKARQKAVRRGIQAEFLQMDALKLATLNRSFDSVIDCGLLHVLSDEDRRPYLAGVAHVTNLGGRVFLMCFSDAEPGNAGPRRISQHALRESFKHGWTVESITATRFEPNPAAETSDFSEGGPKAWFAVFRRVELTNPLTKDG